MMRNSGAITLHMAIWIAVQLPAASAQARSPWPWQVENPQAVLLSHRQSWAQLHLVAAAAEAYSLANRGLYSNTRAPLVPWLPEERLLLAGAREYFDRGVRTNPGDAAGTLWEVGYQRYYRDDHASGYEVTVYGYTRTLRWVERGRLYLDRASSRVPQLEYPLTERSGR